MWIANAIYRLRVPSSSDRPKLSEGTLGISELVRRDCSRGETSMIAMHYGPQPVSAIVPAIAVRTGQSQNSSPELLIERIAAGDKVAMQRLFSEYRGSIYRFILRITVNEALAEDILSEVFLTIWQQADSFKKRSAVSTWLMSIARHKALSARRCRTNNNMELDETIENTVPDLGNDPEVCLLEKDRSKRLRQALARLSQDHREIIDLVYYYGKSIGECAEILNIPAATVKTRMFYARKKLAQAVSELRQTRQSPPAEIGAPPRRSASAAFRSGGPSLDGHSPDAA
jgi:RNA polymerase sigma-70 factor (ECF subfamily)